MGFKDINIIIFEVTNRCNARCVYCQQVMGQFPYRNKVDIPLELVKNVIDQVPQAREVHPCDNGEPLLYPYILDLIRYAKSKGKHVMIYHNGSLMTKELAKKFIEAGLAEIRWSIDGVDKETFEFNRKGLKWDIVHRNILDFMEVNLKMGEPVKNIIRMTRNWNIKDKFPEYKEYWMNKGFQSRNIHCMSLLPNMTPTQIDRQKYINSKPLIWCIRPWQHLTVKATGDIVLCCKDAHLSYIIGNLQDNTVKEIYDGEKFSKIRQSIRSGRNIPVLCETCRTESRLISN